MSSYTETLFTAALQAHEAGDLAGAARFLNFVIGTSRRDAEALYFLGFLKLRQDDPMAALRLLHSSAAIQPDDARMLSHLGATWRRLGDHEAAIASYRAAIALWPDFVSAHANLAASLHALDRTKEALDVLRHAETLAPDSADIACDIGGALYALGQHDAALAHFRRAQAMQPGHPRARYFESLALLAQGDFLAAWDKHEARGQLAMGSNRPRAFMQPQWGGDDDIVGKTILLHAEQGFGDAIQFVGYAPLVAAKGASVLLEVHRSMGPLCAGLPGVAGIVARGDALPPFDLHCPMLSLPRAFGTELATVPAEVPYLHPDPQRRAAWRQRLGRRRKRRIGVAWSGSPSHPHDHARSIPLALPAPLLSRRDSELLVMQPTIRPADRTTLDAMPHVLDHGAALTDFAETAALLSLMDLIITADTAAAHLAGALALPTWVLLPFNPDWRWLRGREDSRWYPTMRLFRQPERGDWRSVIDAVLRQLDR